MADRNSVYANTDYCATTNAAERIITKGKPFSIIALPLMPLHWHLVHLTWNVETVEI